MKIRNLWGTAGAGGGKAAARLICRVAIPGAVLIVYLALALVFSRHTPVYNPFGSGAGGEVEYARAQVLAIDSQTVSASGFEGLLTGSQIVKVRMLGGEYRGRSFTVKNALNYDTNFLLHKGQTIVVSVNTSTLGETVVNLYVYTPDRIVPLCVLVALLIAALCVIGRGRGLRALAGIFFTLTSIFLIFIPLLIRGAPATATTLLLVAVTSCVTLFLVGGFGRKSLAAVFGTVAGVAVSIAVLAIFSGVLQVSGYTMPDADALLNIAGNCRLQVKGLFFAGTVVTSLGAVMDIAISIASAVAEVGAQNPRAGFADLFRSGMNMGRDMMGTMVTTLLLAYAGASVVSFIELYAYQVQPLQLLNANGLTMSILEAVSGSFAVILTVPLVSLFAARLLKGNGEGA